MAQKFITSMTAWVNIYARFALLRAGLRRKEEPFLRLYGTAKAVP
jgi:hypothetical protein